MQQPEPLGQMFVDWSPRPDRVVRIGLVPRVAFTRAETPPPMAYYSGATTPWAGTVRHYEMPLTVVVRMLECRDRISRYEVDALRSIEKQGFAWDPIDRTMYATHPEWRLI